MSDLARDLLLVALDDDTGELIADPWYLRWALAGGVLVDLVLHGLAEVEGDELRVVDGATTDDPVLAHVVGLLRDADFDSSIEHWVNELAWAFDDLQERLTASLMDEGSLLEVERRSVRVRTRLVHPALDESREASARHRVRDAAARGSCDVGTSTLLALLSTAKLLGEVFTPAELAVHGARIARIVSHVPLPEEARRALDEVREVMAVAVVK